ncbi:MAG: peptidoglycan editing factor PgeF [Diaphorobacter nitroreducens]|uniref:peptidoglycan editing factor PgeF n=1 Tax=Diaphorobacter nitroreducens TaxID=164759 RepID=UPI003C74CCB9
MAQTAPSAVPHDWLVPDWPVSVRVRALCTTRNGGVSAPPWDSFNLGRFVGDDPAAVQANWAALQDALGAGGSAVRAVYLRQVHGTAVQPLDAHTPDGLDADGCTTQAAGVACIVMAADCLPVLFTNRAGTRVAAAHAGWRGLAAGVLESTLECFRPAAQAGQAQAAIENGATADADDVMAWLGPCIGPEAFEVGAEVREAFCAQDPRAAAYFRPHASDGKWLADLAGLARHRLRACGVTALYGNDSTSAWCTVANPSRFFSHRRDTARLGSSGRMAACIWLAA